MKLYMKVTSDEYELPLYVASSPTELAEKVGTTRMTILSAISHAKKRGGRCKYVRVVINDEEEDEYDEIKT